MNNKVTSILRSKENLVEKYLEEFMITFHSHDSTGEILRSFIRNENDQRIHEKAGIEARIFMRDKGRINDKHLLHSLEELIYQYFLEYRREHLSRIRIIVNNILG